jgi:hypothetical protein
MKCSVKCSDENAARNEFMQSLDRQETTGFTERQVDDLDLATARGRFPMTNDAIEEFKEVKALAGLTHADNLAACVEELEGEFNLFARQMRQKIGLLKSMINTTR